MRRFGFCSTLIITTLLGGCAHHASQSAVSSPNAINPACQHDPLLMKYGCSVDRIEQAANQGNPDAQYALGYMYYYGINTIQDQDIARLWIERAAKQGQPLAQQALALVDPQSGRSLHPSSAYPSPVSQVKVGHPKQPIAIRRQLVVRHPTLSPRATPVTAQRGVPKAVVTPVEQSLLHAPAKSYTLQLMGNHRLAALQSFVRMNGLGTQASIYRATFDGGQWYMLVYGQFKTVEAAHAALAQLPAAVRAHQPWIKPMKDVQQEIKTRRLVT